MDARSRYTRIDGDEEMAGNFRVRTKEISNQSMALLLFGDFDASSACELIDILDGNYLIFGSQVNA